MMTLPLGIFFITGLIVYAMGVESLSDYLNDHAVAIVVGGTLAVFFFSNPWFVFKHLFKDLKGLLSNKNQLYVIQSALAELAKNKSVQVNVQDELVNYAQDLWKQGVSQDLFIVLLSQKKQEIEQRSIGAIQSLKNLAKYPPALGMAGTVIGVVTLFQSLGSEKEKLGASLALAMTATFLGLVVSNAMIMPLADRLQIMHTYQKQYLQNVYQIMLLINQNEFSELIEEEVNSRASA